MAVAIPKLHTRDALKDKGPRSVKGVAGAGITLK